MTREEKEQILKDFYEKLLKKQQDMSEEMEETFFKHLKDLLT